MSTPGEVGPGPRETLTSILIGILVSALLLWLFVGCGTFGARYKGPPTDVDGDPIPAPSY
jgi:hypothetical protein